MKKTTKKILKVGCLSVILLYIIYLCYLFFIVSPAVYRMRTGMQLRDCLRNIASDTAHFHGQPVDILSEDGKPLLSWRVDLLPPQQKARFNFEESWTSPTNMAAAKNKPGVFFYPYILEPKEPTKTCLVCIKEVAELRRKMIYRDKDGKKIFNKKLFDKIKDKMLFMLVSLEDAVIWTEPRDVSWRDLASGKVKPFQKIGSYQVEGFYYVKVYGLEVAWVKQLPATFEEWQALCDVEGIEEELEREEENESIPADIPPASEEPLTTIQYEDWTVDSEPGQKSP